MRSLWSMACCSSPLSASSEERVGRACSGSSASCLYTSSRKLGAAERAGGARARRGRDPSPSRSRISCSTTSRSCFVIEWWMIVWSIPLSMYRPESAARAAAASASTHAHRHAALSAHIARLAATAGACPLKVGEPRRPRLGARLTHRRRNSGAVRSITSTFCVASAHNSFQSTIIVVSHFGSGYK